MEKTKEINKYELYYILTRDFAHAGELNNSSEKLKGTLVAENKLPRFKGESHNSLYSKDRYDLPCFQTSGFNVEKFTTSNPIVKEYYPSPIWRYDVELLEQRKIFVWLGTKEKVYFDSARLVSYKDLVLLAKNRFYENIKEPVVFKKKTDKFWTRWNKRNHVYAGGSKNSYTKNISKNAANIVDYFEEYPKLRIKTHKEINEAKYRASYDYWDRPDGRKSNGWKDNTKSRKQYLKHVK